jgi:hypothetical protein
LGPHPLWRRSLFDQIGLFDPTYKAAGDFEFQMRFSKCKRIAVHVPLPLSLFYQNLQGLSFADTTSAQEEAKALTHWRNSVEISQIYQVDETDPSAVSRAWAALGQRSLSIKVPWRPCKPLPDLALQCFQKALLHSPDDPWIRSCVRLLERHLSSGLRSQHVLATALPEGIYASPSGEPRPSVPPLRWFPGCATTGHGIVRAHE